jgi:RNA polymerase sigma-70 factor (ECF subfamily)
LRPSVIPERPSLRAALDARLVSSLQGGHPDAPGRLFDRYGVHVARVLRGLLGRDPEAEDLLHEVFAQVFENVANLRDPRALRAWITRITICTARTCVRRRRRSRWLVFRAPEDVPEVPTVANDVDPNPDVDVEEIVVRLHQALGEIKPADRIPFVLHTIHGMSLPDTAEACGCSVATVKRRIARARDRFALVANRDPHRAEL